MAKNDSKLAGSLGKSKFATRPSKEGTVSNSHESTFKASQNSPFSLKSKPSMKDTAKDQKLKIKKKDTSTIQTSRSINKLKLKLKKPKNG